MFFRCLAFIVLCVLLTPDLYAQSAEASSETTPDAAQPVESSLSEEQLQTQSAEASSETTPDAEQPVESPPSEEQLQTLLDAIKEVEAERAALNRKLESTTDAIAVQQIQGQLEPLEQRLRDLKISFEERVTGGLNIAALSQKTEEASFDWQRELQDVARPFLEELKKLTEQSRTIERLKNERALYESRLQVAEAAMKELKKNQSKIKAPAVDEALKTLAGQWQDQRESAESRLQRINAQLDRLIAASEKKGKGLNVALQEFARGRGLNLVLALGGFVLVYLLLAGLGRLTGKLMRQDREPGTRRMTRVIALSFRALTFILALFVAGLILYARGDWLLLGLLILVVISLLWGLKQSLPRYMQEIRILLNIGSIREGERVIYNGTPWQITSLNLSSTLHNPLLRGGVLQLPLDRMIDLLSRPYAPEEPWFPSREGDIVILDGDIYGKVLLQTPEIVQLEVIGSTKTYAIADYLASHPRNLSLEGFAVPIVFGLDYQHQNEIVAHIVPVLRGYLEAQLEGQPFRPHLTDLLVEFNEAASSSLNLLVVAVFTGAGAEHYWSIRRFLQRATVSACNEYGWVIPFDQLTVHVPAGQPARPVLPASAS